jgi:hypothetical protein
VVIAVVVNAQYRLPYVIDGRQTMPRRPLGGGFSRFRTTGGAKCETCRQVEVRMPSKQQVLRLVDLGHGYPEIGRLLDIPAGQAYLVATGIPADGGDTVTGRQRERPGMLPSHSQRLVNPREVNPSHSDRVHEWVRARARQERSATRRPAGGSG